ncbi:C1 family peptidase [Aspergillus brunneoviolaceus CBS 621.78]|uniref:Bleomycin hydrolase n=1 Tax=Aspergillus brunneoviolaceus CBS 621.78 TaxID=1450534 RepID=A0ACD1G7T7_9EURO|nr:putative bleomycin hydrolase [Aspergillus brunneoviolaceus CBS 621.78]RAH45321.1 putative bleomycin hydrolase [Aspergillus brunneoviolaceus CBS 621.78]
MGTTYSKPAATPSEKTASSFAPVYADDESPQSPPPYQYPDDDLEPEAERIPTLSLSNLKSWNESLLRDPKNRLAITTLSSQPYPQLLTNRTTLHTTAQHIFNLRIPNEGAPITNQRSSGRCWLFASTNIFRLPLMQEYNLGEFELSQAYLFYWDKLEKANWFFEQMLATATTEDLSGRLVQKLLEDPVTDGGQWDMVVNLVRKYGLVPSTVYPDNYNAMNSSRMNWLITAKLREQGLVLRRLKREGGGRGVAEAKTRFLKEIHSLVTILLGPAPSPDERFVWQFYDAAGKARTVRVSPREFAGRVSTETGVRKVGGRVCVAPARLFSLVNDPRNEYNRLLTVERLGNVLEGRPLTYVNVEMKILKNAVIAMLKAGHPVFFGCDVGKSSDTSLGVMDADLTDLALAFNVSLGMSKAERLASGESAMTHAMVITGAHLEDDGTPVRWRVENSWGETAGQKGWFVMTDRWMDEYTFQAVVDAEFVSREVREILEQKPKVLPRWDPLGVLA